jgi:hypothetical protein
MQSRPPTCTGDRADGRHVDAQAPVLDNWNTTVPVVLEKHLNRLICDSPTIKYNVSVFCPPLFKRINKNAHNGF